jgi:hypothetical protein
VRQDAHCFAVLLRIIPAQGRTGKEAQQWLRPDGSETWKKEQATSRQVVYEDDRRVILAS